MSVRRPSPDRAPRTPRGSTQGAILVLASLLAVTSTSAQTGGDELDELKRAVRLLQAQNRELVNRLEALEAKKAGRASDQLILPTPTPEAVDQPSQGTESNQALEQRIKELEMAKSAQERATRLIIQESMAKVGSKINEAVTFGGAIELLAGRSSELSGPNRNALKFNTAEIDLEIQVSPWATGSFIMGYDNGLGRTNLQTNRGNLAGFDRVNLDRAFVTIGDVTRFPLYVRAGRMTLPFGISTGVHRAEIGRAHV